MPIEQILLNVVYTLAGLIFHVLKKAATEKVNPIEYVRIHKGRSSAALTAIATGFGTLMVTRPEATPMEFFAVGYLGDSVFNKSPTKDEVAKAKEARALKKAAK